MPEDASDIRRAMYRRTLDRAEEIALLDARLSRWLVRDNAQRHDALRGFRPTDAVIRGAKAVALFEIENSEHDRRHRQHHQTDRTQSRSELTHHPADTHTTPCILC